ncbi:glycosyltransferase [Aeromicrobium wangtongii]|uniref:glycosyltransferase n=1 Tax=Aeromicrobium wangtongii TaxID=2969247 RepID=UPI002017D0A8|nr:glycosyltransferase [Aeromicrobium wangtongii]MCL3817580.1 hypothetical protein [Aeromicrobium wangtongii]
MTNASRMMKIATSIHEAGYFDQTHLVGVHADGMPARTPIMPGLIVNRIRGSARGGNLGRVLRVLMWQPRVYAHYRSQPLAVVAAHNVWVLPLCWILACRWGAALAYNAHELETEAIAMTGAKQRVARVIEARLIARCSIISVVNVPIADWYARRYGIRPIVVGNVPEVADEEVDLRTRLGIASNEMLYIHTGNIARGRSIPLILTTFARTRHHVVFLGDGPLTADVVRASGRHRNIHWLEPVRPDLVVAHVREADVSLCLIEQHLSLSDRLSSPNKLMEALAADTPPLCSELVEARRLLDAAATTWILSSPARELGEALNRIHKQDVEDFRSTWAGVQAWTEEVRPLVEKFAEISLESDPDQFENR